MKTIKQLVQEHTLAGTLRLPPGPGGTSWPRYCVRAEVKAHTRRGINDALDQLWAARNVVPPHLPPGQTCRPRNPGGATQTEPLLITYEKDPADPTRFIIRAYHGAALRARVNGFSASRSRPPGTIPLSGPDWWDMGTLSVRQAAEPRPLTSCPTELGNLMEGVLRREYSAAVTKIQKPGLRLRWRDPSGRGSDILHEELRSFLAELQGELSGVR